MRVKTVLMGAAALLLVAASAAPAQTVDEIVDKSLAAMGGRAALAKVTSRHTVGTMTVSTPGGDLPGTIEVFNQAPNRVRTLINLDLSAVGAGAMTLDQRFDGTSGFAMDTMRGDGPMPAAQVENMRNTAFPTPLLAYKERGAKLALAGKEKLGDRDVYALTLTPASGSPLRLFVDVESYLVTKAVITTEIPEMGPLEQSTEFSDYRDVDGVKVPFHVKGTSAVQTFTVNLTKVEQNTTIDPAVFTKPGGK